MFTLEDITTLDLLESDYFSLEVGNLLKAYNVTNFQELENLILSNNKYFDNKYFRFLVKRAYDTLYRVNNNNNKIVTTLNLPVYSDEEQKLVTRTDKENTGIILPQCITSAGGSVVSLDLEKLSMEKIKYLASKITLDGNNALVKFIYRIGPSKLYDLMRKINFYNEQQSRVLNNVDISTFDGNLFTFNQNEKRELVQNNFDDILRRLFNLSDNYIFGKVSDSLVKRIIKNCNLLSNGKPIKDTYCYDYMILPLIEMIGNYTTLEELQEGPSDLVLRRFVK